MSLQGIGWLLKLLKAIRSFENGLDASILDSPVWGFEELMKVLICCFGLSIKVRIVYLEGDSIVYDGIRFYQYGFEIAEKKD